MARSAQLDSKSAASLLHNGKSRAVILLAAERIFAEAGLDGARTDGIAAAAGVNKALLYYYFRSKDALFQAVLENHMKAFHGQAMRVLSSKGSARDILMRYVATHFEFISGRPCYPRLFQRLIMTGDRSLERLATKYFVPVGQKLVKVIERGQRARELRTTNPIHKIGRASCRERV